MADVTELKRKLVSACRILDREGVMDELGHFSVRCPEKGGVYINGKVSPGQAREKDIILLDLNGNKLEGDLEPASESPLHLAVYQKRPDVMSIAHTHSPMVVTLSIAGVPLRTVENQGACVIGPEAPVFEKYGLVDSFELGYEVAETLGDRKTCVLKSHGNIVVGDSIEETCVFAIWAEKSARYQYKAMLLGEPHWYPEAEMGKMVQQMVKGKGHVRTWNYYNWKIGNKP
ncbi:MAG: class II aldolase/adducin family protein [Deltaproteobacteria bacterium]|nr:class II aldolase/adducin family protein [Deltaproteobacteria bacterium]MBW2139002.1 class II aldolase/adducin family protein [Deltaproteobacteria bacterium]